jgi:DNA-binding MarR family transcriptional regulator
MSRVEIISGPETKLVPDQLIDTQLANLQEQIDRLRERLLTPVSAKEPAEQFVLMSLVQEILRSRRRREKIFGGELFGEPAWDILLEVYCAELTQQKLSVSDACYASAVPHTTALRWVAKLEHDGWLRRMNDPFDGRRTWLLLTNDGSDKMRDFLVGLAIRPTATHPRCHSG